MVESRGAAGKTRRPRQSLLERVFQEGILQCASCGGRREVTAFIPGGPMAREILERLGVDAVRRRAPQPRAGPRTSREGGLRAQAASPYRRVVVCATGSPPIDPIVPDPASDVPIMQVAPIMPPGAWALEVWRTWSHEHERIRALHGRMLALRSRCP